MGEHKAGKKKESARNQSVSQFLEVKERTKEGRRASLVGTLASAWRLLRISVLVLPLLLSLHAAKVHPD